MVMIEGGKDRLIFDASFPVDQDSQYVNVWTNKANEPPLVFPLSFHHHLTRIYNLRITYPTDEIYLWDNDVSSAWRRHDVSLM